MKPQMRQKSAITTTTFCRTLPKVELHAHLTGSINPSCLHQIWKTTTTTSSTALLLLEDPTIALKPPNSQPHHDICTFFKLFDTYIYALVNSPEAVKVATHSVLQAFREDGVRYLELRTTPREFAEEGMMMMMTKERYVEAVLEAIEEFELLSSSSEMVTRLILSIDRRDTIEEGMSVVELAVKFRNRGVVGIDLCGNPLVGPVGHLEPAFQRAKIEGFKITLHFAEVPASSSEEELKMLLEWKPDRIGHVIHTSAEIEDEIERLGIGLELCLSCNVLAKMLPENGGFDAHHFGRWKQRKSPIALSTDDVGVFGSPVSNEYQLAAQHFNLTRDDLLDLSRRAVRSIFGDEDEKARMYRLLDRFAKENSHATDVSKS